MRDQGCLSLILYTKGKKKDTQPVGLISRIYTIDANPSTGFNFASLYKSTHNNSRRLVLRNWKFLCLCPLAFSEVNKDSLTTLYQNKKAHLGTFV